MKRKIVHEIGKTQRLAIVELLKRSANGMPVTELASALAMSYMGVKAHCLSLHTQGYLETWRQPGTRGRPLMFYRLTMKAYDLFSEENNDFALSLLTQARQLFGPTAPQKLLMLHFRALAAKYREHIKETTPRERACAFARLRDREGRLSNFEKGTPWRIIECHNPLQTLLATHPEIDALECQMLSEVIGVPIKREVTMTAGIYRATITEK